MLLKNEPTFILKVAVGESRGEEKLRSLGTVVMQETGFAFKIMLQPMRVRFYK